MSKRRNQCKRCDGRGFIQWYGGGRETCNACKGTGQAWGSPRNARGDNKGRRK